MLSQEAIDKIIQVLKQDKNACDQIMKAIHPDAESKAEDKAEPANAEGKEVGVVTVSKAANPLEELLKC